MAVVQASKSDDFVDSIGINSHWVFPMYATNAAALQQLLIDSGIRHYRDAMIGQDPTVRSILVNLANNGVTANLLVFPPSGVVPDASYWSGYGPITPGGTMTIVQFLKEFLPPGVVTSIEMPNELDVFYNLYKWHPDDVDTLSGDPMSPLYFGTYGVAFTQSAWGAVRADSSLDAIKIIGPSVGFLVPSPFPDASLYAYVDFGCFHTYPARVNQFNTPLPYGTIINYYWDSFQPSGNISTDPPYNENPLMLTFYAGAFTSGGTAKRMSSTETGYGTEAISAASQAKYIPRLFAEYFRNNIPSTFWYELVDQSADPTADDGNDGIIYHNLTPKPSYTALQSMISVLKEPGASFSPGSLNYTLSAAAVGDYTRTIYAHDLLLQKSNGDFFLLLWHEISVTSDTDASGTPIVGPQRDISQPSLLTTITLPATIGSAIVYTYQSDWTLAAVDLEIVANVITVKAQDKLSIIRLRSAVVAEADLELETGFDLLLENGDNLLLENSGPPSTGNSRGLLTLGVG